MISLILIIKKFQVLNGYIEYSKTLSVNGVTTQKL